eukprot:51568-Pyramimonas_sp.AAC.1
MDARRSRATPPRTRSGWHNYLRPRFPNCIAPTSDRASPPHPPKAARNTPGQVYRFRGSRSHSSKWFPL